MMELPEELSTKLDFSHGKKFRKEILQLFGSSVHHTSATPTGSFFLLVTFRRFTFRLSEESVAFALASCLGGAPAGFHVQYQSERHFRFSVSNKAVGFHVCSLRRFIGDHFDAYFHLWRDGTANWEKEKRLWDQEQKREWSEVMSKAQKRVAKSGKKVTFAPSTTFIPNEHVSPVSSHPSSRSLRFGKFTVLIQDEHIPKIQVNNSSSAASSRSTDAYSSASHARPSHDPCYSGDHTGSVPKDSNYEVNQGFIPKENTMVNLICWNCLKSGHLARTCTGQARCNICYRYGHRARWCMTRSKPKKEWRPKLITEPGTSCNKTHGKVTESATSTSASTAKRATVQSTPPPPPAHHQVPPPPLHQTIVPLMNNDMDRESDYPIYQLARRMRLHQDFGPMPSAQMLLQDIIYNAVLNQHTMYLPTPINPGLSQFGLREMYFPGQLILAGKQPVNFPTQLPMLCDDSGSEESNQPWKNNWEASSSVAPPPSGLYILDEEGFQKSDNSQLLDDAQMGSPDITSSENSTVQQHEIAPWRLPTDVLALQLLPQVLWILSRARKPLHIPQPSMTISEDGTIYNCEEENANGTNAQSDDSVNAMSMQVDACSPDPFEFQTMEIQPGPSNAVGQKEKKIKRKRKNMALSETISISDMRTPLTQNIVRRSSRLAAGNEGYRSVRIDKEPSKRSRNWVVEVDEATGEIKPISIPVLQGWGLKCGVDPEELTEEALMQAPPTQVPNEDQAE